jgi:hypothetical protein
MRRLKIFSANKKELLMGKKEKSILKNFLIRLNKEILNKEKDYKKKGKKLTLQKKKIKKITDIFY